MDSREGDVERFFRGYGTIRDVTLKKGYGFVVSFVGLLPRFASQNHNSYFRRYSQEFDDYRDAEDAIDDLNGKELLGERLVFVNFVKFRYKLR